MTFSPSLWELGSCGLSFAVGVSLSLCCLFSVRLFDCLSVVVLHNISVLLGAIEKMYISSAHEEVVMIL